MSYERAEPYGLDMPEGVRNLRITSGAVRLEVMRKGDSSRPPNHWRWHVLGNDLGTGDVYGITFSIELVRGQSIGSNVIQHPGSSRRLDPDTEYNYLAS